MYPLMRGVERSEQNNPVSCFANGDRRFLRDVTSGKIQNVEQKSRTIPRGMSEILISLRYDHYRNFSSKDLTKRAKHDNIIVTKQKNKRN